MFIIIIINGSISRHHRGMIHQAWTTGCVITGCKNWWHTIPKEVSDTCPQSAPFCRGSGPQVYMLNNITTGSAIFAGHTVANNTQTVPCHAICRNSQHPALSAVLQRGLITQKQHVSLCSANENSWNNSRTKWDSQISKVFWMTNTIWKSTNLMTPPAI